MLAEIKTEMQNILTIGSKMYDKLTFVLSKAWGWISVLSLTAFAFFQPVLYIYWSIIAIIIIDAFLGIAVSKKKGTFILSYLGRETSWKILFYTLLFIAIHIFERTFSSETNIGLLLAFSVAGIFEIISILANSLILKPDFALFKLLIRFLKGEIARKLSISEKDVEEALNNR